jgi:tRNA-Thr(GGU) m(6)t(6)A37 methyltransferase TsaA
VPELLGKIVFIPKYRDPDALRGIEEFSHLWLIFDFSKAHRTKEFTPTVRPPRLGGNTRVGVFASRSPFRPNNIGLSSVKLIGIETDKINGDTLIVAGADLLDGTPIYDIKPYIPYTDCHTDCRGGFADSGAPEPLEVEISDELIAKLPVDKRDALISVLAQDPRPGYQRGDGRRYGIAFAGFDVRFTVDGGVLHVREIIKN